MKVAWWVGSGSLGTVKVGMESSLGREGNGGGEEEEVQMRGEAGGVGCMDRDGMEWLPGWGCHWC
jgi:hypothetical protein